MPANVIVIGGGLGGLATAALVARDGFQVTLVERSSELGGRARSERFGGGIFNLGPHGLYRRGGAMRVLDALGVSYSGGMPSQSGNLGIRGGHLYSLPAGAWSFLSTRLMGLGEKLELARFLRRLPSADPKPLDGISLTAFLGGSLRCEPARAFLHALVRLTSYVNAPDDFSAGAAVRQLQSALRHNVLYLHGGWQTLVAELRRIAEVAGARILTGVRAASVRRSMGRLEGVCLADGTFLVANAVVVAAGDAHWAAKLLGSDSLAERAQGAVTVRAACLNLALSLLPDPRRTFALGIDTPTYFSVHTRVAQLGDPDVAVVHLARYLGPSDDGHQSKEELLSVLDLCQPGWRGAVIDQRFMPNMTVMHDIPRSKRGGLAGRPTVAVPDVPDAYVVGDWVGGEGLLADAVFASSEVAARAIASRAVVRPAA